MKLTTLKPMGIGEVLDLSFHIYRKHFKKVFLLMLIFIAPVSLLQSFLTNDYSQMSLFPNYSNAISFEAYLMELWGQQERFAPADFVKILLFILIVLPVSICAIYPLTVVSILHLVKSVINSETIKLNEMIKRAFSRFWPIVGSTLLFSLILFGMLIALSFSLAFVVGISAVTGGFLVPQFFESIPGIVIGTIAIILMLGALMLIPAYLILRWSFYLLFVAQNKSGIGLAESWQATKGNFWRLFAVGLILFIVNIVVSLGFGVIIMFVLGFSVIGELLQVLVSMLIIPIAFIAYAVVYFDLLVRKEGIDIETMIQEADEKQALAVHLAANGE